jgi:catechol 2,3-dioxygenase-like lactoylglutathione lyase family enzyme
MTQHLGLVSVVVRDYDEAVAFYVGTLGFQRTGISNGLGPVSLVAGQPASAGAVGLELG